MYVSWIVYLINEYELKFVFPALSRDTTSKCAKCYVLEAVKIQRP